MKKSVRCYNQFKVLSKEQKHLKIRNIEVSVQAEEKLALCSVEKSQWNVVDIFSAFVKCIVFFSPVMTKANLPSAPK
jgi:hypothetical protein